MKPTTNSLRILIGGATGFIGRFLSKALRDKGHSVIPLTRTPKEKAQISWAQIEKEGLPEVDVCINVSGANIMEKRWTQQRKKVLLDSREGAINSLVKYIKAHPKPPKHFIGTSAVGYYPTNTQVVYDELYSGPPANNFAGELCSGVEKSINQLQGTATKCSIIRPGVVLGPEGALMQMALPLRIGWVGKIGDGNQYFPWITIDDLVSMYIHCIELEVTGILNGVAPEIVTNNEFSKSLGEITHSPVVLTFPEFIVRPLFGESHYLLTQGQKVKPDVALKTGFNFKYPTLRDALIKYAH